MLLSLSAIKVIKHQYKSIPDICSHFLKNKVLATNVNHYVSEDASEFVLGAIDLIVMSLYHVLRLIIDIASVGHLVLIVIRQGDKVLVRFMRLVLGAFGGFDQLP